jgi:hypothetical protein
MGGSTSRRQDAGPHVPSFEIVHGRLERVFIPFRYAWRAELDLMAQLAGTEDGRLATPRY